jgi:outer membrane immunogenic protein
MEGFAVKRISTLLTALGLVAFATSAATAADLRAAPAYKAAPAVVAPYYNWTGFYIGAHVGGGWADKDWSSVGIPMGSHTADGFLGGGQIGFNWQTGPWVLGIEAQVSWADLTGDHVDLNLTGDRVHTKVNSLGSVAGRVGYAWDRWMLYGKIGWGWAHDKYSRTVAATGAFIDSASKTQSGWMLGIGIENGITPNWSWKLEYNYMDMGSQDLVSSIGTPFTVDQQVHVVKLGINYRFGYGGPVVTKY